MFIGATLWIGHTRSLYGFDTTTRRVTATYSMPTVEEFATVGSHLWATLFDDGQVLRFDPPPP